MSRFTIDPNEPVQFSNILAHLHNPPPPPRKVSPPPDLFPEEEKKEIPYVPTDDSDSDIEENGFRIVTTMRWDPVLLEDHRDWHSTSSAEPRSPFLLLPYHLERLIRSAVGFGWNDVASQLSTPEFSADFIARLEDVVKDVVKNGSPEAKGEKCYKIRCVLRRNGNLTIHLRPVGPRPFDLLGAPFMTPAYIVPLTPNTLMTWPTAYAPILDVFLDTDPTTPSLFTRHKSTNRDVYDEARDRVGIESYNSPEEVLLINHDSDVVDGSMRNICIWRDGSWVTPPLASGCLDGVVRRWMLATGKVKERRIRSDELINGEWVLTSNSVEGCSFGKFVADREEHRNNNLRIRRLHPKPRPLTSSRPF
ncbi:aminotransferase class IV-domain-containing protein [Cantharellus anzutake]|uniref:aminotransferase class IV-domain-containing protein n=1 Tax=Cantharellus anzutake TaxID=1750568 RepID=UPI001907E38D|nr:aminotransferase class IV-domain-containing protein [Cantharellus anzutake]KAF8328135.1 aminotransferase class IV-domain-containing protein [Cantharellus anzutake]